MADANVTALQIAINRFAAIGGFSSIGVDGQVGSNTAQGTMNALSYIIHSSQDQSEVDTASGLANALVSSSGAVDQGQISASAGGLASFLNGVADEFGAPAGYAVPMVSAGSGGGSKLPTAASSPILAPIAAVSFPQIWAKLATWQKVAAGAVAGLALMFVVKHWKHHKPLAGLFGPTQWYRVSWSKHGRKDSGVYSQADLHSFVQHLQNDGVSRHSIHVRPS